MSTLGGAAGKIFAPLVRRGSGRTLILSGVAIIVAVVAMSVFAPYITGASPTSAIYRPNLAPSTGHPLGTDIGGRDVLARVVYGGRFLLVVAFLAVLICMAIGVPIGLASAYRGGLVDRVVTLLMDSIYAFPSLVFSLLIIIIFGPTLVNYSLAIAVVYIPSYFRVVRSQTLSVKQLPYVDAAHSVGAGYVSVIRKYIWPNIIPSVVVVATINFADAILITAGLDFIGVGDLLKPDWGVDLYYGRQTLLAGDWWTIVFSGVMILITALGFSLISEGYAERTNPKLR
ncbi:MAG TPA: ABC transporter permease [Nitrososphaerales archaeon]|nr:ABC transporter permease [Nitrososphaerales archaeon]